MEFSKVHSNTKWCCIFFPLQLFCQLPCTPTYHYVLAVWIIVSSKSLDRSAICSTTVPPPSIAFSGWVVVSVFPSCLLLCHLHCHEWVFCNSSNVDSVIGKQSKSGWWQRHIKQDTWYYWNEMRTCIETISLPMGNEDMRCTLTVTQKQSMIKENWSCLMKPFQCIWKCWA